MEAIIELDQHLFQLINSGCQNAFLDWLMPMWRNKLFWMPLYMFLVGFLLVNYKLKGFLLILTVLAAVGISDFTSSQLIKKNVQRFRPCKQAELVVQLHIPCGSGYSFPSSHATNHFAIAILLIGTLGCHFRWIKLPLFLWAASIALGQVYVGVHYPIDILAGALLGTAIGSFLAWRYKVWEKRFEQREQA